MTRTNTLAVAKVFQVLGNHTPAALLSIPEAGYTHPSQISRDIGCSTAAVSTILAGLERRRFITRHRHKDDPRMMEVRLTRAGSVLQEAMIDGLHAAVIGGGE